MSMQTGLDAVNAEEAITQVRETGEVVFDIFPSYKFADGGGYAGACARPQFEAECALATILHAVNSGARLAHVERNGPRLKFVFERP